MRSAAPACLPVRLLQRAAVLAAAGPPGSPTGQPGAPAGQAISPAGLITGAGRTLGTSTVTVTGTPASGASACTSFAWTISPAPGS